MSKVLDCINNRRSCRSFSQRNILSKIIKNIVNSAFKVPKSQADNFLHLFVLQNNKIIEDVFWFCPGMDSKPNLIIILGSHKKLIRDNSYYPYLQMGCSLQNILLTSYSYGVGSVPVGSANLVGIKSYLNINEEIDLKMLISLGIPKNFQKELTVDYSNFCSSNNINYY